MKNHRKLGLFLTVAVLLLLTPLAACKRAPELSAPDNASVTTENGALHVSWDAVDGADCYYIYRIKAGDESYGYWGVTRETQLTDETLTDSAVYAYKIFGAQSDGKEYARSNAGTATPYACYLQPPQIKSVVVSKDGCTVSWEPVEVAEEYEVLRSDAGSGDYTSLARTKDAAYTDVGASAEKSYSYQVRAHSAAYEELVESAVATAPDSLTVPQLPKALRLGERTVTVCWEQTQQAVDYIVYRAFAPGGPYVVVGETDGRVFHDGSLPAGTQTVTYMVQSSSDADGVALRGLVSAECAAEKPSSVTGVPVIMYRDFVTAQEMEAGMTLEADAIYVDELEQDLRYLKANGYHTVGLKDLAAYLDGKAALPERPVLLSFDACTAGVYKHAFPLLKEYGMRALLNVVGSVMDEAEARADETSGAKAYCSWEEIGEMGRSGAMEILPYGYHLNVTASGSEAGFSRQKNETMTAYTNRLSDDLLPLNEKIEQYTGQKPLGVAYPYSLWSDDGNAALSTLGYRFMLAGDSARMLKMNYFVDGLDPALQDPMLSRIARLTGTPVSRYLRRARSSDAW